MRLAALPAASARLRAKKEFRPVERATRTAREQEIVDTFVFRSSSENAILSVTEPAHSSARILCENPLFSRLARNFRVDDGVFVVLDETDLSGKPIFRTDWKTFQKTIRNVPLQLNATSPSLFLCRYKFFSIALSSMRNQEKKV